MDLNLKCREQFCTRVAVGTLEDCHLYTSQQYPKSDKPAVPSWFLPSKNRDRWMNTCSTVIFFLWTIPFLNLDFPSLLLETDLATLINKKQEAQAHIQGQL